MYNPFSNPWGIPFKARFAIFLRDLWSPLCRHNVVHTRRAHANTVGRDFGKELYIDVHNMHVFVRCSYCMRTLHTSANQYGTRERLCAQKEEE